MPVTQAIADRRIGPGDGDRSMQAGSNGTHGYIIHSNAPHTTADASAPSSRAIAPPAVGTVDGSFGRQTTPHECVQQTAPRECVRQHEGQQGQTRCPAAHGMSEGVPHGTTHSVEQRGAFPQPQMHQQYAQPPVIATAAAPSLQQQHLHGTSWETLQRELIVIHDVDVARDFLAGRCNPEGGLPTAAPLTLPAHRGEEACGGVPIDLDTAR